jgi:hypothetical protein
MYCQVDHTVQGKDPCKEVPGFSCILVLIASTHEGLEKSSSSVMRTTSTLENSFEATPKFEDFEVQTSTTVPQPGSFPLERVLGTEGVAATATKSAFSQAAWWIVL